MGMYAEIDLRALGRQLDARKKLVHTAARPAAKAIADVYYEAVRSNVAALGRSTGNLYESIYRVHSASRSVNGLQVYEISWNKSKAPHGHLVEFGYLRTMVAFYSEETGQWRTVQGVMLDAPVQIAAKPFLRPALDRADAARAAGIARFQEVLARAL